MIHIEPNRGYSKTCGSCHNGPTHLKWYFFPYPLFVDCWSSWKYYHFNSVTVSSFITLSFLSLVYLYHYDRCAFLISRQARLLAGFLVDWYINTGAYERCFFFWADSEGKQCILYTILSKINPQEGTCAAAHVLSLHVYPVKLFCLCH